MSDLIERLGSGPICTGETEDGEYEIFDVDEAAQTMDEAADEIERLTAELTAALAKLAQYEQAPVVGWAHPQDIETPSNWSTAFWAHMERTPYYSLALIARPDVKP